MQGLVQTKPCPPLDCQVTSWVDLGICDPKTGLQQQKAGTITPGLYGGLNNCDIKTKETPCKVDCKYEWNENWTYNEKTGMKSRKPYIIYTPLNNGEACPQPQEVPYLVDCQVTSWIDNGQCVNGIKQQKAST